MTTTDNWQVRRLAGSLGAEITGPDLNAIAAGDEAGINAVKDLLREHQVIFFPGQQVDIESHVALGKRFGKVENHPNLKDGLLPYVVKVNARDIADGPLWRRSQKT